MTITQTELISRLLELPRLIDEAEELVFDASYRLQRTRGELATREAEILTETDAEGNGILRGKNEAQRAADLRLRTADLHGAIRDLELAVAQRRIPLGALRDEFSAARSIARLLGAESC